MKHLVFAVFLGVVALFATLYFRLGGNKDVTVTLSEPVSYRLLYKDHLGPYHKIVPVIEEVEKWAKANGQSCQLSFGEYLGDPDEVSEDRLRSRGGCVLDGNPSQPAPEGFKTSVLPPVKYAKAEFDGAPSLGPLKVYPKIRDFIAEKNLKHTGSILELYEILPGDKVKTTYLFPVQ